MWKELILVLGGIAFGVIFAIAAYDYRKIMSIVDIAKEYGCNISGAIARNYYNQAKKRGERWVRNQCADIQIRTLKTKEARLVYINDRLSWEGADEDLDNWAYINKKELGL